MSAKHFKECTAYNLNIEVILQIDRNRCLYNVTIISFQNSDGQAIVFKTLI